MKVVLVGNECNYKTTVAEKLSKKVGYPIRKGSSFEMSTGTNEDLYAAFLAMTEWENTIIDRFIHCNRVYATLYPKYTILTDEQYNDIQKKMNKDTVVIYLYAETEVLKDRMALRGDEYVVSDMLGVINDEYDKVMKIPGIMTIKIDTGERSSDDIVHLIHHLLFKNDPDYGTGARGNTHE